MLRVYLDHNNDLPPGGPRLCGGPGALDIIDEDGRSQRIDSRLASAAVALQAVFGTQAGEWPFNLTFGMRWRQEVFGKYFDANATAQVVAATANTVTDIEPVTSEAITLDTLTQADARQVNITIDPVIVGTATGVLVIPAIL
jgi:hypothetical protein